MNTKHSLWAWRVLAIAAALVSSGVERGQAQSAARFDAAGNLAGVDAAVPFDPPVLRGPASRLARPGEATALSVAASGVNVSFRWFFNGAPIAGATSDTLLIGEFSELNVGEYHVVAANSAGETTSPLARLDLDEDRDGLADAWELAHFGSLTSQKGAMDEDEDGTLNRDEFQDGTDPTDDRSLRARLEVRTYGGWVAVSPDLADYANDDWVELAATPPAGLSFIGWSGALTGTANPASLRLTGNMEVQATFGLPLAASLNTAQDVVTGGAGGWYGQSQVTRDGQAAVAVTPPLAGRGDPYLETTMVMSREGTATFDWRTDGEADSYLRVSVDGSYDFQETRTVRGVTGWQSKTVYLPAGSSRLRWTYVRGGGGWTEDSSLVKPRGTAYVDRLVVAEYANPLLDTDGNGLPDLWEYRYFDRLANDPNADPDLDGVPTRIELSDGTHPGSDNSTQPRVSYLIEGQGTAVASPNLQIFSYGQTVTNIATPAQGWQFVGWVGPFDNYYFLPRLNTNNPSSDRLYQWKTYRAIFGLPPGLAADQPQWTWRTSAELPWYGQSIVTHDGNHAAQSAITVEEFADSESWLETTVAGPGTLSFFWKASTAVDRDYLTLLVNGEEAGTRLSGLTGWQPVVISLPSGSQTLRWLFKRFYGYDTNALNRVWIDRVTFTAGSTKPEFIELPVGLQGHETQDVTFRVTARGTPPISYQVLRNGVALTQASEDQILTVPAVNPAMAGNWIVRARNAAGSTDSAPIPVDILALPPNDDFANASVLSGSLPALNSYSIGATAEDDEPHHDSYWPRASVWHRWVAPTTGGVRVTAIATNPPGNLILAAYRGTSLSALTEITAQNAFAQETNGVEVARVDIQWRAVSGTTYHLAVDTDEPGALYRLSFASLPVPVNDAFAARLPLSGTFLAISGDNTLATAESGEPPIFSFPPFFSMLHSNTLWWSWQAPISGPLRIVDQPDEITALVSIFTGTSLGTLNRLTDPFGSTTELNVTQGTTYAISADGFEGETGHFTFLLAMDGLSLRLVTTDDAERGEIELRGPPQKEIILQFSPNLSDWYPWSTNTIPNQGVLRLGLDPPLYHNSWETTSIPPAAKRFFRAVAP